MRHLVDNARSFQSITERVLHDMFALETTESGPVREATSVNTDKTFIVSIYYTGTVYGEYVLALDESTAARIVGIEDPIDDQNRDEVREQIADAFSEILNMVVGECLVQLQSTYAKLTLTPPRVYFGKIRYPNFRTGWSRLQTTHGAIECHFCLDLMRLDLAASYSETLASLLDVNAKLKQANERLAEQQAQLVHSEKMASVGILASGVAHEINNPLFFVEANLKTLADYVTIIESVVALYEKLCGMVKSTDSELLAALAEVRAERDGKDLDFVLEDTLHLVDESRAGVQRIQSIVRGLKEFSHVDVGGTAEADLHGIIRNALLLVSHSLGDQRRVDLDFVTNLPRVICNAGEIGQVLINMLINSAQAIDQSGSIRVQTRQSGDDVSITIEDTGHGIAPEHLDRIFDPFFTTKPTGEGVGLGLAISYGIIQKHRGSITVESEPGKGTKFTIRLPIAPAPALAIMDSNAVLLGSGAAQAGR